jgi:hypothetical protein
MCETAADENPRQRRVLAVGSRRSTRARPSENFVRTAASRSRAALTSAPSGWVVHFEDLDPRHLVVTAAHSTVLTAVGRELAWIEPIE